MTKLSSQPFFYAMWSQTWTMPYAMSKFFERHNVKQVIELGTGHGIPTLFFGIAMAYNKGRVITIDVQPPPYEWNDVSRGMPIIYMKGSWIEKPMMDLIVGQLKKDIPTLVFCDDGNKPMEVKTIAPYLKVGDYIMAHDWGTEIVEADVKHLIGEFQYCEMQTFDGVKSKIVCLERRMKI